MPEGYLLRMPLSVRLNTPAHSGKFEEIWGEVRKQVIALSGERFPSDPNRKRRPINFNVETIINHDTATIEVRGKMLRIAWTKIVGPVADFNIIGLHKDDADLFKELIGTENELANEAERSGREVTTTLGIEPVRLLGSKLWRAYDTGSMDILPEKYRGLAIAIKLWAARKKPSLFASPSAMPALYEYFHVMDSQKKYLGMEETAGKLDVKGGISNRQFIATWKALEAATASALDGEDIKLGETPIDVAILRQGTRLQPRLQEGELEKFRMCMEQEVGFSAFGPSGRGGSRGL